MPTKRLKNYAEMSNESLHFTGFKQVRRRKILKYVHKASCSLIRGNLALLISNKFIETFLLNLAGIYAGDIIIFFYWFLELLLLLTLLLL